MKIYKTSRYSEEIKEFELIKATAKQVFYRETYNGGTSENRSARQSDYSQFFDTKEEAIEFLIQQARRKIERAERHISEAEAVLKKYQSAQTEKGDGDAKL